MQKPLPTPFDLHNRLTQIIASHTGCETTWAHHTQPMSPVEMMAVRKAIAQYMTSIAVEHFQEAAK